MLISHQLPLAPHAWDESQTKAPRTKVSPDTNFHSEKFMRRKMSREESQIVDMIGEKGRWRATRRWLDYVESYNIKHTCTHVSQRAEEKGSDRKSSARNSRSALSSATKRQSLWSHDCGGKISLSLSIQPSQLLYLEVHFKEENGLEPSVAEWIKTKVMTWQMRYKVLTRNEHNLKWPRWTHKRKMMARMKNKDSLKNN